MHHIAQYANIAYCPEKESYPNEVEVIRPKPEPPGFKMIYDKTHDRMIICFIGKKLSRIEWETRKVALESVNITLPQQERPEYYKMFIDSIWNKDVKKMLPEIFEKLDHFSSFPLFIQFVGHGVGGAYAVLAALYYRLHLLKQSALHKKTIRVTTFGQPRIGSSLFASLINKFLLVQRITHSNDYVPRSFHPPPQFQHHDREFWIARDDCNCTNKKSPFSNGYFFFECPGYRRNWNATHGENQECNQGTIDDLESWTNDGPYFGVTMGKCDE
ncbi:hypothetical protein G9A89_020862 [Geosiphon pyriformis]|nr:hypothetical protein G9A89_020862 [Geosiphon pyriformis]